MASKTQIKKPMRKKAAKKETEVKTSDILSFSSALIAVISSAILYLAGWFYLVNWYAFFSIDASQINLSPQIVIIHGLPSILILILAGFLAASVFSTWKLFRQTKRPEANDFPIIVISAYLIAFLIMAGIGFLYVYSTGSRQIPGETIIALLAALLLAGFIYFAYNVSMLLTGKADLKVSAVVPGVAFRISLPRVYAISKLSATSLEQHHLNDALKLELYFLASYLNIFKVEETEQKISLVEKEFIQSIKSQQDQLTRAFAEVWQFWVGAILILYLLVSIGTSAIFGVWDATRGGRFMLGGWDIPEVSLFSSSKIPALEKFEIQTNDGFEYKPLGLLTSDDRDYYLVDWKTSDYYTVKPKVYIIPRSDSLDLNIIVSPYVPLVSTLIPTSTSSPTLIPTVTITPTP